MLVLKSIAFEIIPEDCEELLLLFDSEFDTEVTDVGLFDAERLFDSDVITLPEGDGVAFKAGDVFIFLTPLAPSSFSEVDENSRFALTLLLLL